MGCPITRGGGPVGCVLVHAQSRKPIQIAYRHILCLFLASPAVRYDAKPPALPPSYTDCNEMATPHPAPVQERIDRVYNGASVLGHGLRLKRLWERARPSKYSPHDLARDRGPPARPELRGQSPLPQSEV